MQLDNATGVGEGASRRLGAGLVQQHRQDDSHLLVPSAPTCQLFCSDGPLEEGGCHRSVEVAGFVGMLYNAHRLFSAPSRM